MGYIIPSLILLACIAFFTYFITTGIKDTKIHNKNHSEMIVKEGIKIMDYIIYIGGFKGLLENETGTIKLLDSSLKITLPSKTKILKYTDIIDFDGKLESEIKSDVTLSRLLVMGVFAFGAKKKTTVIKRFIIITYNDSDKECKVILQCQNAQKIIRKYYELMETA